MGGKNWNEMLQGIKGELDTLTSFIDKTKGGIDSLEKTIKMSSDRFPEASQQLGNVTCDLEKAANDIMTIVENLLDDHDKSHTLIEDLQKWTGSLPPESLGKAPEIIKGLDAINNKVKDDMMTIMTNLSFQDLTGQKLKKVIGSLSVVESKLLELTFYFGFADGDRPDGVVVNDHEELKGPSHPDAMDQDAVEKLLKDMGR